MTDELPAPPRPTFGPEEKLCGNCKLWSATVVDHRGWVGPCRLQPSRGMFPPSAPICDAFAQRGLPARSVEAVQERNRVARDVAPQIRRRTDPTQTVEPLLAGDAGGPSMTRQELMELFLEAAGWTEAALAPKWEGGVIQILPGKKELQGKELPIDTLFHKVVMVRNQLRTLEQKINSHERLTEAEKVELQQYLTRCYGSLTTFNVLFRDKEDNFVGAKGEG